MSESEPINPWRETVRDLYDDLHFGQDNIFTGSHLAKRLISFIENRHPGFFNEPRDVLLRIHRKEKER